MNRRDILKLTGVTGISVFLPWGLSSQAHADEATWGGPYFLHMHAAGGWDPTLLCDGKLTEAGASPRYQNRLVTAVGDVNGIPIPTQTAAGKYLLRVGNNAVEDPEHFFRTIGSKMLVINGVDTRTNSHETGVQALGGGNGEIELPALAALFAGMVAKQRDVPMAFVASGVYNRTGDVVGASRFPGDKVPLLADPFKFNANDMNPMISPLASRRILELRDARIAAIQGAASLPRNKRTVNALRDATRGGGAVSLLQAVASEPAPAIDAFRAGLSPDTQAYLTAVANNTPNFVNLGRPLETILRCFREGVSASATYAAGGFDTHSNHDTAQPQAQANFLAQIRYVLLRAQQMGIADKLYLLVTSDFGRTPLYNTGNGKDHWNVTSVMVSGPGVRGGRAVGKTDEGHKVYRVDKNDVSKTLPDTESSGGSRIYASHIHRELRRVLNLPATDFIGQFPLPTEDPLNLLT